MSILKEFIPLLKMYKGIFFHFNSCLENLLETDEGKTQFVAEQLALKFYESLDKELLLELDAYTEDFFSLLTLISELGKLLGFLLIDCLFEVERDSLFCFNKK